MLRKTFSDGLILDFGPDDGAGEGREGGFGNGTPVEDTGTLARPPGGGRGGRPRGLPPLLLRVVFL